MMKRQMIATAVALLLPVLAFAQTPPAAAPTVAPAPQPGRGGGANTPIVSPEIAADGRVTFRLRAPAATAVNVAGLPDPLAMTKDEQGVWSATTAAPLAADIYAYTFDVDGARVTDPSNASNPLLPPPSRAASQLMVPGALWTSTDVPHGAVTRRVYKSPIIGADETYYVYTPPGYDAKRKKAYPVVVLLHGLGDQAPDWLAQGGANLTLDGLIAQGKAVPMILVSPSSYGNNAGTRGAAAGFPNFTNVLIDEIMPQVEREYNASKRALDHAVSGLSMGAAQSPLLLNRLDQFAWIGEFSPGFDMYGRINNPINAAGGAGGAPGPGRGGAGAAPALQINGVRMRAVLADNVIAPLFPKLSAKDNAKIKLLYLACGTNDDHLALQRQFKDFLDSRGVKITTYLEVPNYAHEWPFWRLEFSEFAQRIFK